MSAAHSRQKLELYVNLEVLAHTFSLRFPGRKIEAGSAQKIIEVREMWSFTFRRVGLIVPVPEALGDVDDLSMGYGFANGRLRKCWLRRTVIG